MKFMKINRILSLEINCEENKMIFFFMKCDWNPNQKKNVQWESIFFQKLMFDFSKHRKCEES